MTKAMVDQLNIFYETFPSFERHIAHAASSIGIARLVQAIVRHEATGEPEMSEKARKDFDEVVAYVSNICGVALNGEKLDIPPLLKSKLDSLLPESKTATGKGVKDSSAQAAMEEFDNLSPLGQKFGKKRNIDWAQWSRKFASKRKRRSVGRPIGGG